MYDQFKTDEDMEKDGIWVDYGNFRVRVGYAGGANKKFAKEMEKLARPYRRAIATSNLPDETAEDIMRVAYARAIIKAWETKVDDEFESGIESPDGEMLEFNVENVHDTLKALPKLYADLQEQANSWALFKASLRDEAAKN
jgi:hypothetical protein